MKYNSYKSCDWFYDGFQAMMKAQNEMNGSVSLHAEQTEWAEEEDNKFEKSQSMMGVLKSKIYFIFFFDK